VKKIKLAALISALITASLLYIFLSSLGHAGESDRLAVVTAAVDIPSDTLITEDMVTVTKLPADAILGDSATEVKLVYGKVAKTDIFAGEQILKHKLVSAGDTKNEELAYTIEPGMRAISIAVDSTTGLAGMLKPNYKVDIISDFDREIKDGSSISYTTMVAEDITILSVDSVLSEGGKEQPEDGKATYSTITLQVTPDQAMKLSLSEYKGHLRAILRSPLDEKKTNLPSVTLDSVM
jgi:pilus assembly protein CpaB